MRAEAWVLAFAAFVCVVGGCREPAGPAAIIHTKAGDRRVALEVARTPETLSRGLMWRESLADGTGMLFLFEHDDDHAFWMKNTLIPLDMLFIARDGTIVGIRPNTTPLSTERVSVGRLSRWVLEVPGGWCARVGVAAGDRIDLQGVGDIPGG